MKFGSIGTRALWRWLQCSPDGGEPGFTLIEALVALTLILAFAAVSGPLLFDARRIVANADGRVAAQILLAALLQDPIDRTGIGDLARAGETEGLQWRIEAEPTAIATSLPPVTLPPGQQKTQQGKPAVHWTAYRVAASVSWAPGQVVSAETVRLGKAE
jgi:prepilin-type N-terminal cleavage/methylation domain-containing protein